jgi:hypothetical protein
MRKIWLITAALLAITVTLFAKDDKMINRGPSPAAQGTIHTDKDRNGNTKVEVEVKHIATPQKLTPPHQYYEVWVQDRSGQPQALGELRVNGDDAAGSVKGTTPAKVFDVFITAEDQRNPTAPSGPEILRGQVDRSGD